MKRILLSFIFLLLASVASAQQGTVNPVTGQMDACLVIEEQDGSPSNHYCGKIKVPNDTLTVNTDGSLSLATGGGSSGSVSGDSLTVNSTSIDTTGNLKDTASISWSVTDGGVGGPDDIEGTVTESDPQVGAVTASKICIADGNKIECSGVDLPAGTTLNSAAIQTGVDDTGTDDQTIDVSSFSTPNISLSLEGDGEATKTIDISGLNLDPDNLNDEDQGDVAIDSDTWKVQEVQAGAISEAGDIDNDIITHAQIADADQTDCKTIVIVDVNGDGVLDGDDDLQNIWANYSGNDFLLQKIYSETDTGTVDFDLQVDDGTPADVNGTDMQADADGLSDDSLGGDTTVADTEKLDLLITTSASTPTQVSITFCGNWVD